MRFPAERFSEKVDSEGNRLTVEQEAFFKDSKVRDKKGNLLTMYHGTKGVFTTFRVGDVGFHFGTKSQARSRVGGGKNTNLVEVYLDIKNPIEIEGDLGSWEANYKLLDRLEEIGILTAEEAQEVKAVPRFYEEGYNAPANRRLRETLKSKGYDGVRYINRHEGGKKDAYSFIVFDANQIKRVDNENPTPDPDIRFSEKRKQELKQFLEGEPVSVLSGTEFQKTDQDLVGRVFEYFKSEYGDTVSNPEIGDVLLTKRGIKDSINHGIGKDKASAFKAVPEVISKGQIISYEQNWKDRKYDGYVVSAPIEIRNKKYICAVVVKAGKLNNKYYVHEAYLLSDIKEKKLDIPFKTRTDVRKDELPGGNQVSIRSILQDIFSVNTDAKFSEKTNVGYHAGDLGKAEYYFNQYSSNRSTGHFGTGTYFVGNKIKLEDSSYKDRPKHTVNFDGYNLYQPYSEDDAFRLHEGLAYINKNHKRNWMATVPIDEWFNEIKTAENLLYEMEDDPSAVDRLNELVEKSRLVDKSEIDNIRSKFKEGDYWLYDAIVEEFRNIKDRVNAMRNARFKATMNLRGVTGSYDENMLDSVINRINETLDKNVKNYNDAKKHDSASTLFMKHFGYEGVDVRNFKSLDNTAYGSVIYDLKTTAEEAKFSEKTRRTIDPDIINDEGYQEVMAELQDQFYSDDRMVDQLAPQIKDVSSLRLAMTDIYRNLETAFGKHFPYIKERYLDPFDDSKKEYFETVQRYTDRVYKDIVKGLGIKKGSKESQAVQWIGEGKRQQGMENKADPITGKTYKAVKLVKYTLQDLQEDFPTKWQDIVKASEIMRGVYNELIDEVNDTRRRIYPNNPSKLVPKRQDYFRHYREMAQGFQGLFNLFAAPSEINPSLVGISEFTNPKSKWASFMQQRGWGPYKEDAIGGFLDYIQPAAYSIHIDPHITQFRGLAKQIAEATAKTKNANNTILFLRNYANALAGKTIMLDRVFQDLIGRRSLRILNAANTRIKKNQILYNARSALSQMANIPVGVAKIKNPAAMMKGIGDSISAIAGMNPVVQKRLEQSQFIRERYMGHLLTRFDARIIDQPEKLGGWIIENADRIGTGFIWNSAYHLAESKGYDEPVRYADELTRSLVGGRGIGEVPLLQQSKIFQVIAPFQLEVVNLWHVIGGMKRDKDIAGLLILAIGNWLFNNLYEELVGDRVVFDPIDAVAESIKEGNSHYIPARLAGEVLSNMPLGAGIAGMWPEYGKTIKATNPFTGKSGEIKLPTREKLFGDTDPTRYGSSILLMKGLDDPFYRLIMPFGGSQLKKTKESLEALNAGEVSKDGEIRFLTDKDPVNVAKGLLFGKYATESGKRYLEKNRRSLTEKQSAQVRASSNPEQTYEQIMFRRKMDNLQGKVKDVFKSADLSEEQKKKEAVKLLREMIKEVKDSPVLSDKDKANQVLNLQGQIKRYQ